MGRQAGCLSGVDRRQITIPRNVRARGPRHPGGLHMGRWIFLHIYFMVMTMEGRNVGFLEFIILLYLNAKRMNIDVTYFILTLHIQIGR